MWNRALGLAAISAALAGGCGCFAWGVERSAVEVIRSQAALANEKAALIRQYRECLKSAETNSEVDCSGYRTAVEVLESDD
jgi:hypothetical protein